MPPTLFTEPAGNCQSVLSVLARHVAGARFSAPQSKPAKAGKALATLLSHLLATLLAILLVLIPTAPMQANDEIPASAPLPPHLARLKDLTSVEGIRDNQLIGYGIVVGLAGTGDKQQTIFSYQSLTNMLERLGVSVSPTAIRVKNTAAVMVTASLPAFAQPGMRIDTTVAAVGDAANLQGGILVFTSLRGAD